MFAQQTLGFCRSLRLFFPTTFIANAVYKVIAEIQCEKHKKLSLIISLAVICKTKMHLALYNTIDIYTAE